MVQYDKDGSGTWPLWVWKKNYLKNENESARKIYTRLLNVPWQALASCVSGETALWVFVIHSLHTP